MAHGVRSGNRIGEGYRETACLQAMTRVNDMRCVPRLGSSDENRLLALHHSYAAGWLCREKEAVISYLQEENRILRQQLRGKRLRFSDGQRRRLFET